MALKHSNTPPGAFPVVKQRKKLVETNKLTTVAKTSTSLGFKSTVVSKLKSYFHKEEQLSKSTRWSRFWYRRRQQQVIHNTSNTVYVGTVFSLSVPITISTTHYGTKEGEPTKIKSTNALVQQLVILPPLQVYGFMFIAILFLLVIGLALVEVHRTISIIELGVDGIKYVVVGLTSNFISLVKWF